MKRFVLLSLVFLGLGFYELSGGNNFDPQETRAAAVDARMARAAERSETVVAAVSRPAPSTPEPVAPQSISTDENSSTDDNVTRTQLDLVSFEAVTTNAPAPREEVETVPLVPDPPQTPIAELATRAALEEEPLSLASLETPTAASGQSGITFSGSTQVAASTPTTGFSDIRLVKGDLVNMRSGPGTDYDVVDQLTQSTEVEVLSSNGEGWVELRRLDSSETGWIAEFLLTGS